MGENVPGVHEIDHWGDVGLEIWGASRAELLENATRGLFGLMTWSQVEPVSTVPIEVHAELLPDLLVDWLSAVILSAGSRAELYPRATVHSSGHDFARGILHAAPIDAARHQLRFDVKAATYHDILVERTPAGYHARVIFDL